MTLPGSGGSPIFLLHVGVFTVAALACFASIPFLHGISDIDTRRGLTWLLATSGGWSAAHVGFLVAPGTDLKIAFHIVGLVVGFATVGPWLYICSAYTGRAYHLNPTFRRAAVAVFLLITAVKVTNPLHHLYFTTVPATEPFPHLAVVAGPLHWVAMGLAYALAFVGYFMLLELFMVIDYDTRPLLALLAITGSPIVLDLLGAMTGQLVDVAYEPLGVAVFAIGVAFVYQERFDAVQLAGERDEPVIALDQDGHVRDANRAAMALFPSLQEGRGEPFEELLPDVAACFRSDTPIMGVSEGGPTRYYRITETPYGTTKAGLGRTILFTDITNQERYRRELERQNERLETFAGMVSHDLRNPLNVAQGRADLIAEELGSDDPNVEAVEQALDRMEELIDDILTLARTGQPVEDQTPVSLDAMARASWEMVESDQATIVVEDDTRLRASPDRLKRLFENLFRNSVEHGSTDNRDASRLDDSIDHVGPDVTVFVGPLPDGTGFYIADDGPGIPPADRDDIFEPGFTTRAEGTGFGLAIVKEVVDAHGWDITVTDRPDGGARFEISGVELVD